MKLTATNLFRNKKALLGIWISFLVILFAAGIVGAAQYLGRDESASIPWGLLVPGYVFFSLAAAGSTLITSLATVFKIDSFKPIVNRGVWLSLILMVPAMIFVLLDLGKSSQSYNIYFSFHGTSRLAWMGVLYMIFTITLVLQLVSVIREKYMPKWIPFMMGIIVLAVALIVETNLGALFGSVEAKPLWNNSILPLHFIITALMAGACVQILFISLTYISRKTNLPKEIKALFAHNYRPILIGLIIINFSVIAIKFIPELMSAEAAPYVKLLIAGPYSVTFWGLEIVLGGIVPILLLLNSKTKNSFRWLIWSSAFILIGVFFSKYDLIIAGQSIGPTFYGQFIPYFPSAWEFLIIFGGLAAGLLVFTLGELVLPLDPREEPSRLFLFKKSASTKQQAFS